MYKSYEPFFHGNSMYIMGTIKVPRTLANRPKVTEIAILYC